MGLTRYEQEMCATRLKDNHLPYIYLHHTDKEFCKLYTAALTWLSRDANWAKNTGSTLVFNIVYRLPHDFKLPPEQEPETNYEIVEVKQDTYEFCYKRDQQLVSRPLHEALHDPEFIGTQFESGNTGEDSDTWYPDIHRLRSENNNKVCSTTIAHVRDDCVYRDRPMRLLFRNDEE